MLVDGRWVDKWQPVQASDDQGRFIRQDSGFRHRIGADSPEGFAPEAGRYVLYVAYVCPWACRTLIALRLKGLEHAMDVRVVDPRLTDQGWAFSGELGTDLDDINGARHVHALYTLADPAYTGRATVPLLWDRSRGTIVNNESADILLILNDDFSGLARHPVDLRPAALVEAIDAANARLYADFNNGVYQAGFATTQREYGEAVRRVFECLDWMDARLANARWLVGEQPTETDVRAFVTLARFDLAYYGLFKCNLRPLAAYPNVMAYFRRLLAKPAFASSVRADHIKAGYYSIRALNPTGIVPAGPLLDYL